MRCVGDDVGSGQRAVRDCRLKSASVRGRLGESQREEVDEVEDVWRWRGRYG